MNFHDDIQHLKNVKYQHRGVKEILKSLLTTAVGIHQIVVYPSNLEILRETYFYFIKKLLEDKNEMVIFLPSYEDAESVKKVLSSYSNYYTVNNSNSKDVPLNNGNNENMNNFDPKRYIDNGSLVILDSSKTFNNLNSEDETTTTTIAFKDDSNPNKEDKKIGLENDDHSFTSLVRMSLHHAKKLEKDGVTILADYGFIYKKDGYEKLLELEKSIPPVFNSIKIKQICLYHQNDFFDKFTKNQKKELLDLHTRSIILTD